MFFRENPFYLLGVHSRDTAETIRTASLEKQGAAKSGEEKHMYQLAEERLLHESSRFRAELSWLCGMGKERAYSLIDGRRSKESQKNLLPSLRLFLAVHDLYNGGKDALSIMETITRLYPASDTNEVLAALRLTARLTGLSHPLLSGAVELTQGILALPATPTGFVWAAALLGWGGLSVHGQSAAVLSGTDLPLGPYLAAKAAQAALSALLAWPVSRYLWG